MSSRLSPARRRRLSPPRNQPVPVSFIFEKLLPEYGPVRWQPRFNALDELIFTVLTQHTSDLNAERAFSRLKDAMPGWAEVMACDPAELARVIASGGLANQKSVRIQRILQEIMERHGSLDLEFLRSEGLEPAREWLTSLPGVGPKTAAVVMAFALGMPAMPVDTHIHRVSGRLGMIRPGTSADDAHVALEKLVEPGDRFALHVLLINHGRKVCRARRPNCSGCQLASRCPSRNSFS